MQEFRASYHYFFLVLLIAVPVASRAQFVLCSSKISFDRTGNSFGIDRLSQNLGPGSSGNDQVWAFNELLTAGTYQTEISLNNQTEFLDDKQIQYDRIISEGDTELFLRNRRDQTIKSAEYNKGNGWKIYRSDDFHCLEDLKFGGSSSGKSSYEWYPEKGEKNTKYLIEEEIQYSADARGLLYMPDGVYDALRVQKQINRTVNKMRFISNKWINVFNDFFVNSAYLAPSVTHYYFLDQRSGNWLASMEMNPSGSTAKIFFRMSSGTVSISGNARNSQFYLYPTSSFGDIRIEFVKCASGTYTMEIFNIIGKRIWAKEYYVNGDLAIREDLGFLPKGTYRYAVTDGSRNRLATRRFAIIKP